MKTLKWNLIFSTRVRGPSGRGPVVRASPERFILHAFSYASDLKLSSVVDDKPTLAV